MCNYPRGFFLAVRGGLLTCWLWQKLRVNARDEEHQPYGGEGQRWALCFPCNSSKRVTWVRHLGFPVGVVIHLSWRCVSVKLWTLVLKKFVDLLHLIFSHFWGRRDNLFSMTWLLLHINLCVVQILFKCIISREVSYNRFQNGVLLSIWHRD